MNHHAAHDINTPNAWEETKQDGTLPFLIAVGIMNLISFIAGIAIACWFL